MEIHGPIASQGSLPFGSARSGDSALLDQFRYVEEEFFVSGRANVYGPDSTRTLEPGETTYAVRPLATVCRPDVAYRTRALVIRPKGAARFSGIVHAIPFHNLNAYASIERNLLRHGDAWIGLEVCSGTRFGHDETPSGGIANLHAADPARYCELTVTGGDPADWGQLVPGALGRAFERLNFGQTGPDMEVFVQELFRSYAHGPDIFFQLVDVLRREDTALLPGCGVRRIYTTGASGASQILRPLVDYHHDAHLLPDGSPPIDGYLIRVGVVPAQRPRGAVLAIFQTEAEAMRQIADRTELPDDTDEPRFRYYELPGTGHLFSAPLRDEHSPKAIDAVARALPKGIQGLSERDQSSDYERYDKVNTPILWALWEAMYRWVEDGIPMPRAERIRRDRLAPDGIARDQHGNALGGLRTPWVDVPDAQYVARISAGNPLEPGMKRFTEERMRALYGSLDNYRQQLSASLTRMIEQRWLLPEDVDLMLARPASSP